MRCPKCHKYGVFKPYTGGSGLYMCLWCGWFGEAAAMNLILLGFFYLLMTGDTSATVYGPFPTLAACLQDQESYARQEATSACWWEKEQSAEETMSKSAEEQ